MTSDLKRTLIIIMTVLLLVHIYLIFTDSSIYYDKITTGEKECSLCGVGDRLLDYELCDCKEKIDYHTKPIIWVITLINIGLMFLVLGTK